MKRLNNGRYWLSRVEYGFESPLRRSAFQKPPTQQFRCLRFLGAESRGHDVFSKNLSRVRVCFLKHRGVVLVQPDLSGVVLLVITAQYLHERRQRFHDILAFEHRGDGHRLHKTDLPGKLHQCGEERAVEAVAKNFDVVASPPVQDALFETNDLRVNRRRRDGRRRKQIMQAINRRQNDLKFCNARRI